MKHLSCLLFILLLVACKDKTTAPNKQIEAKEVQEVADPNWLLGDWKRNNDKEGSQTYEYWDKNKLGQFVSTGVRLEGIDTTWMEHVLLHKVDGTWLFEVTIQNDPNPTVFKVTRIDGKSFVCENPDNEFPKQISYAFDGENLNAEISGGGPTIGYQFIKMD